MEISGRLERINPAPWFTSQKADPQAKLRLFCFPYAGGGASIFRGWNHYLPAGVDVWSVQLPGRGGRYREVPYGAMGSLVKDVTLAIKPFLDRPFCFFGHSLGAIVSFEVAHCLGQEFDLNVEHLFVSGAGGPHLPRNTTDTHHLPDDQFMARLKALNGTPPEVWENPELLRMMLTTLRADFKLAETYACSQRPPLQCPITAFGGLEDSLVSRNDLKAWRTQTTNAFDLWLLPGDHFFVQTCDSLLLQILHRETKRMISAD